MVEFMMKRIGSRNLLCALGIAAAILTAAPVSAQQAAAPSAPAAAQPTGVQAALVNDVGNLSDKFVGLARVMAGKYDWRPGPGVRSVGDVFNLIVNENKMLTGLLSGSGGAMPGGGGSQAAPITDAAEMQEALRASYAGLRQAIAGLPQSDLSSNVRLFGRETTKQGAAFMLLMDQHEHLGQSIAYARTNGVVPPWSK
jgi:uncharacterized damage-inducible protein DinB